MRLSHINVSIVVLGQSQICPDLRPENAPSKMPVEMKMGRQLAADAVIGLPAVDSPPIRKGSHACGEGKEGTPGVQTYSNVRSKIYYPSISRYVPPSSTMSPRLSFEPVITDTSAL